MTRISTVAVSLLLLSTPAFAVDVDLRTANATGSIGVAKFQQIQPQSTGTGVIEPFVRIQNNGTEAGFNTDHSPLNGDLKDVKGGTWTHSLLVNALYPVVYEGVLYARFMLDVNQTGSDPQLSLNALRVYTAGVPNLSTNAALFSSNLLYDMGAGNRILLDASLNSGSGSGDMFCYIPWSLFTGLGTQYLYLYSAFGLSGGSFATNDGFEEWAHVKGTVLPVEATTWSGIKKLIR